MKPQQLQLKELIAQLKRQTAAINALAASNAALAESNMALVAAMAEGEEEDDATGRQTLDGD